MRGPVHLTVFLWKYILDTVAEATRIYNVITVFLLITVFRIFDWRVYEKKIL